MDKEDSVGQLVRKLEREFTSGQGTLMSKYVTTDLYEDINKVYAYLESKHVTGPEDSLGREKPFFNIVVAARNVRYRATDIDRKNIKVRATKTSDIFADMLATIHLQKWMREENFGKFLNIWGLELASFNDVVCKFVEKDGRLVPSVVPWSRLIVDQINFHKNIKIEMLEFTEAQLRESNYPKDKVEELLSAHKARELLNRQKRDNKNNYFKVYEVHGVLPLYYLTGKESDRDTFVQQMHVISFMANNKNTKKHEEYCLYKGKEAKDPYMLTSLMPSVDGSIMLNGVVKEMFEAQWMVNHTKKQIKDQLDLASKLIFQTSDGNFVGQNALSAIESGDIMIHAVNQPLTQLANNSHDITSLQNFGGEWKALGSEIAGVSESMLGNAAPSGTAWRQVEALLQESHSLFELMTENKGLCIEEMLTTYVIPFIKKKMDTAEEISAVLEAYDLEKVDRKYVPAEATNRLARKTIRQIIDTKTFPLITQEMQDEEMQKIQSELDEQGNQRFFKPDDLTDMTWKEVFKDLEWKLEIDITGEQKDTQSDMATLSTMFGMAVSNPDGFASNPYAKLIMNKVLLKTGTVNPVELQGLEAQKMLPQPATPVAG